MSKVPVQPDRSSLPKGWGWADWTGAENTQSDWAALEEKVRQGFRGKMTHQYEGLKCGRPVGREIFSLGKGDDGIAKVRMFKPNPGLRAYCFCDDKVQYVSHIAKKHDGEHDDHVEIAKQARREHLARKKTKPTKKQ